MRPSGFSVASWFGDRLRVDSPKADQRQDDLREPCLGREVTRGRKGPVTHDVPGSLSCARVSLDTVWDMPVVATGEIRKLLL